MAISKEFPRSKVWSRVPRSTSKQSFTLIELLVVMGLMLSMMALAMVAFVDWGRGTGMRTSVRNMKSTLVLARQWAITHRAPTTFAYSNTVSPPQLGWYTTTIMVSNQTVMIGNTNYLTKGVVFESAADQRIKFNIDGTCDKTVGTWTGWKSKIALQEINQGSRALSSTTTVYQLTGRVTVTD